MGSPSSPVLSTAKPSEQITHEYRQARYHDHPEVPSGCGWGVELEPAVFWQVVVDAANGGQEDPADHQRDMEWPGLVEGQLLEKFRVYELYAADHPEQNPGEKCRECQQNER